MRHQGPLVNAIAATALPRVDRDCELGEKHGQFHGLVQSLWCLSSSIAARDIFEEWLRQGAEYDVATSSTLLLDSEWCRSLGEAQALWDCLHEVVRYPPLQLLIRDGMVRIGAGLSPICVFSSLAKFHREEYLKLARLVQYLHTEMTSTPTPELMLGAMKQFSQTQGSWLKVASGAKASCLEESASTARKGTPLLLSRCFVEFGAFVGYSAVTVVRLDMRARFLSCEIDPVHVVIARFVASLAVPSADVNFRVGRAGDLLPWLLEDSGASSVAFVFMDHSNTHFHEDYNSLEKLCVGSSSTQVLADNVLKPGAPIYLWHASWSAVQGITWSMCEFRQEDQEDWMAVVGMAGPIEADWGASCVKRLMARAGGNALKLTYPEDPFTWRWS